MPKKKRAKYNEGSLTTRKNFTGIGKFAVHAAGNQSARTYSVDYQTPKEYHSFGMRGQSDSGITGFTGSTGTDTTRLRVNVGVGPNKGGVQGKISRNLPRGQGELSFTAGQRPTGYGMNKFVNIGFTRKF